MITLVFALVLWATMVLAQIPIPIPHVPGLPVELPVPPLMPASTSAIVVQPSQRLVQVAALDGFAPARYASLVDLSRDADGAYSLSPGAFELIDESFCLRIAGHAPGSSDSYFIGALSGDRASYVRNVLRRWRSHPEIDQESVQLLLWAITSRSDIGELAGTTSRAAHVLLTPQEIYQLNGGALGMLRTLNNAGVPLPAPVQQALLAESQVRDLLTHGNYSYQEIAAIAAPRSQPQAPAGVRDRWSFDPHGYFIRYLPLNFPTTIVQIVVPPRYAIARDARGRITSISDVFGSTLTIAYGASARATLSMVPIVSERRTRVVQRIRLGTLAAVHGASISRLQQFAAAVRAPASFVADAASVDTTARAAERLVEGSRVSFDKDRALDFLREALPYVMCQAAYSCNGGQVASASLLGLGPSFPTFDPSNNLGAPNNGSQQPLGQSGNPAPYDKSRDCDGMREQLSGAKTARAAYNNPALAARARAGDWSGSQLDEAVQKLLSPGGSAPSLVEPSGASQGGGQGGFGEGGYTDIEGGTYANGAYHPNCVAHVPSEQEVLGAGLPLSFRQILADHEAVHVAQCTSDPTAYARNTWDNMQRLETEAYNKEIDEIEQWLRENCG